MSKPFHYVLAAAALLISVACAAPTSSPEVPALGVDPECSFLTATDIAAVTGVDVRAVPRGSTPSAGGTCGNYLTLSGDGYLGVSALRTSAEFERAIQAVPVDIYSVKQSLAGVGDEAVLFKDSSDRTLLRYLVVREGDHGAIIFPMRSDITDAQLRELTQRALAGGLVP